MSIVSLYKINVILCGFEGTVGACDEEASCSLRKASAYSVNQPT
ncbi:hypothetical protein [Heyndrickxia acidicola]|uniref:Uncharacterized protein n=1 Tax=Heyndrickxia acidicola TaxID=209389 RepID=A0ABU6MK65_9BACI|nr:hypothetical protein [Heyndrickxia acidicola]MED1205076.1 hypothetical protein [Heyndrickxia acidicola]